MPSADRRGISAALARSAAVGLLLETGSEKSPVASTLSFDETSVDSLLGCGAWIVGGIGRSDAMGC